MSRESWKDKYLNRVKELLRNLTAIGSSVDANEAILQECYTSAVSISKAIYGPNSPQLQVLLASERPSTDMLPMKHLIYSRQLRIFYEHLKGFLHTVEQELTLDLIGNIATKASGAVYGDFLELAKAEVEDFKDVAAVLASAAFEDALKRKAISIGLDVQDKELSEVANALAANRVLEGAQVGIARAHVKLRNYAMHAEWEKFDKTEVKTLIAFVDSFLMEHFS